MSQENQNIKPPSSPEKLPFWKALLVKALRGTIGVLENTAENLETEPIPGSEEKPGFLQKIQQLLVGILGKIRLIIPVQFSAKLSDTALTGIIGGLIVMIFLITSNVLDRKPPQVATVPSNTEIPQIVSTTEPEAIVSEEEIPPVIEQTPPEEIISEPEIKIPPVTEKIPLLSEEETISQPEIATPPAIEKTPLPTEEEIVSKPEIEIPPVIAKTPLPTEEEIVSKPDEIPQKEELETTPPPIPLTPEETLIAAIQNQVGEISLNLKDSSSKNPTFAEIIESIQANFLNSNLTIKINNDWYSLEKKQQNKLAAEILQRSQELDFTHLEITDLQGKLIARNPVVGTEMIIFKR